MKRTCKILLFGATCISLLAAHATVRADLVMHLTGDGTALDSSGNGHHGTLQGGASYAAGELGQAFSFNANGDHVTVAGSASLEPTEITVAFWLKTTQDSGLKLLVDSSHGASNGNFGWAAQIQDGIFRGAYGNGSNFHEVATTTQVADNQFHHVAMTLDGTTLRTYVDGVQEGSTGFTGTAMGTGDELRLGRHFSLNRQFLGSLDDIRVYNEALSDTQIASLAMVPEPNTAALAGILSIAFVARRRRKR